MADMWFSDDDLHDAMRVCLETLMRISASEPDVVHRANAAIALANLVLGIYDRQNERDIDAAAQELEDHQEDEPDEPQA